MDDIDLVVRAHELAMSDAQYTLNDYKEMLKEQKCECYTCIYAPNKECGWYAACNNCIDGSNYWRKSNECIRIEVY